MTNTKFTEQQLDELFAIHKIGKYLTENYPITREHNVNIYDHIVYPLCIDKGEDDIFYRCVLHQPFKNIWFSSFIHHVLVTEPEKHKQYIREKLFKSSNVTTTTTSK